jgi:hypothetical protein
MMGERPDLIAAEILRFVQGARSRRGVP